VQTVVGVAAGSLLTFLPAQPVRIASGLGFLVFAVMALRRKEDDDERAEEKDIARAGKKRPVWLVAFLVIFAAEWGDLTQLATAALVARGMPALSVGIGAVLALWSVTVIAAVAGVQLGKYLKPRLLNIAGGILFAVIGVAIIWSALR
jgi:putative Ca2+/H+ antiporter (TMEM165/GDT1 family)